MEITTDYKGIRDELGRELQREAEGFVKIGYLLRKIKEEEIYIVGGYNSITEFAQAEFGLKKQDTSYFIRINAKYSKDGYSQELEEQFKGFGRGKLGDMLNLPDDIIEEITPNASRKEIQELNREIKSENTEELQESHGATRTVNTEADTNTEVEENILKKALFPLFKKEEWRDKLADLWKMLLDITIMSEERVMLAISKSGFTQGKAAGYFVFFKEEEITCMKGVEKKKYTYQQLYDYLKEMLKPYKYRTWQDAWSACYGEEIQVKVTIEPVEKQEKPVNTKAAVAPKTEKKEVKEAEITNIEVEAEDDVDFGDERNQEETEEITEDSEDDNLPGQSTIEDFPEAMPTKKLIDDLELSVRGYNVIKRHGINTIDELCELTRDDVSTIRNIGLKNVTEIEEKLGRIGRKLKFQDGDQEEEEETAEEVICTVEETEIEVPEETQEAAVEATEIETKECLYCNGDKLIVSNNGKFSIKQSKNGLARIEYDNGSVRDNGIIKLEHCLFCGKKLGGE